MSGSFISVAIWPIIAMALGAGIYFLGMRKRTSLDTPLISNHSKTFIGGTLFIIGLCVLAYFWLKQPM